MIKKLIEKVNVITSPMGIVIVSLFLPLITISRFGVEVYPKMFMLFFLGFIFIKSIIGFSTDRGFRTSIILFVTILLSVVSLALTLTDNYSGLMLVSIIGAATIFLPMSYMVFSK